MNLTFSHNGVIYSVTPTESKQDTHMESIEDLITHLTPQSSECTWGSFVVMWNEYAQKYRWKKILITNKAIQKSFNSAKKDFPSMDQWRAILNGVASDRFFGSIEMKASILFTKKRYFEFYESGLESVENKQDSILSDLRGVLDGIA